MKNDILDTAIQVVGSDKVTTIKQFLLDNSAFVNVINFANEIKPLTGFPSVINHVVEVINDKYYIIHKE